MHKILIFLFIFAIWNCDKPKDAKATKVPESNTPTTEPMHSSEARQPLISPQPLQEYRKYTGTIHGKVSITMDLTFKDGGNGLVGHGRYFYDQEGISKSVHADFFNADRFEFELWDTTGNFILETLTGQFKSLESFEGVWTRYQPDSIQDPKYDTWKKLRIRKDQGSFTLTQSMEDMIPLRFEVFKKENDSTSRLKIMENQVKEIYDSFPSSLKLAVLRVQSGRDSMDSVINLSIDRTIKEFCLSNRETTISPETPISQLADSLFERAWADTRGEFFDEDFETEVEANENGLLSLKFSWSGYAGGAHPSDDHIYASIDVATGRRIGLKDIFVPDYKDELGALAGEPSCDGDPEYTCNIEGIVKKGFAIQHHGIVFHANIGLRDRDVVIAYDDLAPLIKKGGILERFLGQGGEMP